MSTPVAPTASVLTPLLLKLLSNEKQGPHGVNPVPSAWFWCLSHKSFFYSKRLSFLDIESALPLPFLHYALLFHFLILLQQLFFLLPLPFQAFKVDIMGEIPRLSHTRAGAGFKELVSVAGKNLPCFVRCAMHREGTLQCCLKSSSSHPSQPSPVRAFFPVFLKVQVYIMCKREA